MTPHILMSPWTKPKQEISFKDACNNYADNRKTYLSKNPFYEHGVGFGVSDPFQHCERYEKERSLQEKDVTIPFIKERSQQEINKKSNRRKQKIEIISSRSNLQNK